MAIVHDTVNVAYSRLWTHLHKLLSASKSNSSSYRRCNWLQAASHSQLPVPSLFSLQHRRGALVISGKIHLFDPLFSAHAIHHTVAVAVVVRIPDVSAAAAAAAAAALVTRDT